MPVMWHKWLKILVVRILLAGSVYSCSYLCKVAKSKPRKLVDDLTELGSRLCRYLCMYVYMQFGFTH